MYLAFLYVISNEGVDTESSYPFKGKVAMHNNNVAMIRNHSLSLAIQLQL